LAELAQLKVLKRVAEIQRAPGAIADLTDARNAVENALGVGQTVEARFAMNCGKSTF